MNLGSSEPGRYFRFIAPNVSSDPLFLPMRSEEMLRTLHIPWIDNQRPRRVGELIGILWILSLADLVFTLWAHSFTPFSEINPLARLLLSRDLMLSLVLFKMVLTSIGATIFWRLRFHAGAELMLCTIVMIYVLLILRWSTYTQYAGSMV